MSKEAFVEKFRHTLLGLMADAWAARREPPSDFGRLMDLHMQRVRAMVNEMYDSLAEPAKPNGQTTAPLPGKRT